MTLMEGTIEVRAKEALAELLDDLDLNFLYDSPTTGESLYGSDGSGRCCWFDDEATSSETEVAHMVAGTLQLNETLTLGLKIQALGKDSTDTQVVVDRSASDMLGRVRAVISQDPTLGLTDDEIQMFYAIPGSAQKQGGVIGEGPQRAAAWTLSIEITARLILEVPA